MIASVLVAAPLPPAGGPCSNAGQKVETWELRATDKDAAIVECRQRGGIFVRAIIPDDELSNGGGNG
ncbi:hypothetical protein [Methyloceanibacter caenitepidi]|uniref:Uncharacterized protein n=1 Tax=Methyloceanibacter caenitepidi TaxID=1384459 RepID=A0A0A8K1Y6_9HYPH|nr:hypothetical protein [Methyloceanibacter caenitepidi]BAQ16968.1 hypothetical protein GL4_1512 [Methyloceanibacter caenitepidi]